MNIGIVGHEAAKFTPTTERRAREIIRWILRKPDAVLVSGHCHLGGIDIWAEEEFAALHPGVAPVIHAPKNLRWADGFRPRNELIARDSNIIHNIVVTALPETFQGTRYEYCYHCKTYNHVKSGGCWTAHYAAKKLGRRARWWEIAPDGTVK